MKTTSISFISILIIISNLYSQRIPYGLEFQVDANAYYYNEYPSVTKLEGGGFLVCWQSWRKHRTNPGWDISGQVYDATGAKMGNEFKIDTFPSEAQKYPKVLGLPKGLFIIFWQENIPFDKTGIYGQMFDASYQKMGNEMQVSNTMYHYRNNIAATGFQDGGFVVSWVENDAKIFGQLLNPSGTKKGDKFLVNTSTKGSIPAMAGLKNGDFVICWGGMVQGGASIDIFCQRFDASGIKKGNEIQVNTYTNDMQHYPAIAGLENGGFIICWVSNGQDGSNLGIFGQLFDSYGSRVGNEFQVNSYNYLDQISPAVTGLSHGGFVVCWESHSQDGSGLGVFGQLFGSDGVKIGYEFPVNSYTFGRQGDQTMAAISNDVFVVCWQSQGRSHDVASIIFSKFFLCEPIHHQLQNYSLLEPLNDMTLNITYPTFTWQQPSSIRECYPWELTFDLYIDININFFKAQIIKNIQDTTYTIYSLEPGKTYFWKVLAKNLAGDSLWSTQQDWGFFIKQGSTLVENADDEIPQQFELCQNYPNPFNSSTTIRFLLPQSKSTYHVTLKIYDIRGRLVNTLVNQNKAGGMYSIRWDGRDYIGNHYPSGIYFYSLEAESYKASRKILLIK